MSCRLHEIRLPILLAAALVAYAFAAAPARAGEHSLGLGLHYWQTADDLIGGAGLDDEGVSWVGSYQFFPSRGIIGFEIDLEYFGDGFGGSAEAAEAPVFYVVFGKRLYVAGGIGVTFSSGLEGDVSDPFYAGRIGYQLGLLPGLKLDLNANYRTNTFDELGDLDTDTLTLGVLARLKI